MVGWLRILSIQGFLAWQSKLLMTYKHLSHAERYHIHALMKTGHGQSRECPNFCVHRNCDTSCLCKSECQCTARGALMTYLYWLHQSVAYDLSAS